MHAFPSLEVMSCSGHAVIHKIVQIQLLVVHQFNNDPRMQEVINFLKSIICVLN